MKEKDNGVIFLKDWLFLITPMSPDNQLVFWSLFTNYEYGTDQICDNPFVAPTWNFIKSQLDNMRSKYKENIVDRNRINGSKGGRPRTKTEKPKTTENNPQNPMGILETEKTPNNNNNNNNNNKDNNNEKDNVNDILLKKETKTISVSESEELFNDQLNEETEEKEKSSAKKEKKQRTTFSAPSVQTVQDYCNERQNGISGYSFVNFYQSKDWMIGKNKMKDWKAAVRTWEDKNKNNGQSNSKTRATGNGLRQSVER